LGQHFVWVSVPNVCNGAAIAAAAVWVLPSMVEMLTWLTKRKGHVSCSTVLLCYGPDEIAHSDQMSHRSAHRGSDLLIYHSVINGHGRRAALTGVGQRYGSELKNATALGSDLKWHGMVLSLGAVG